MVKERKKISINVDNVKVNKSMEEIQKNVTELSSVVDEIMIGINKQFSDLSKQVTQALKGIVDGIDFSHLSKIQKIHIQNIMKIYQQGWKLKWFLPDVLIEVLLERYETLTEDYEFDEKIVVDYFVENFDFLSNQAINHPFYKNHIELLLDSKKLYMENRFAISAYPLFSAIDNVFTRWVTKPEQFHLDNNTTYISGEKKKELKVKKEDFNPIETLNILHLSIYAAYEGYLYYFKNSKSRNTLNRNIYMHGNYNYSLMDKFECLKLWSFLLLCIDCIEELQGIKKNEFNEVVVD